VVLAAVAGLAVAAPAHAAYIVGSIAIGGTASPVQISGPNNNDWSTADGAAGFTGVTTGSASGDFAGVPSGTSVTTFSNFNWNPSSTPVSPLWSFTYAGLTYSFTLNTVTLNTQFQIPGGGGSFVNVSGTGFATITGGTSDFQPTFGQFTFTGTDSGGGTFGFSANTTVTGQPIPEPATMTLIGTGLAAAATAIRRRRKV
jgi:hypothetical protein